MPPIGAQGLNLSLRDIATLYDCLLDDPGVANGRGDCGSAIVTEAYGRRRRFDVASRLAMVDGLNRTLISNTLPANLARTLGLHAIAAIAPLRRRLMRESIAPSAGLPSLMRAA